MPPWRSRDLPAVYGEKSYGAKEKSLHQVQWQFRISVDIYNTGREQVLLGLQAVFSVKPLATKEKTKIWCSKRKKKIKNNINISLYCTSGAFLQCFLTCFWKIQLQCLHSSFLLCMLCDEKPMHFRINMGLCREN